jgi:hypothetical protein
MKELRNCLKEKKISREREKQKKSVRTQKLGFLSLGLPWQNILYVRDQCRTVLVLETYAFATRM